MADQQTKTERVQVRIDPVAKHMLERAAALANTTVSAFVVNNALEAADRLISKRERLAISQQDWDPVFRRPRQSPQTKCLAPQGVRVPRTSRDKDGRGVTFTIEALAQPHDRSRFSCGSEALDQYIRLQASQDTRRKVARVFVALPEKSQEVAGFYALSAGSIERATLPPDDVRRLPHYPVPVALIGRLAVDRRWAGQGLGSALLADAFRRVVRVSESLAVYAVVVDAK